MDINDEMMPAVFHGNVKSNRNPNHIIKDNTQK